MQAVVRLGAMGSVVRVAGWLELHMELVVHCRPAVFTALAMVDRLAAGGPEDWSLVLDRLAADSVSMQPLVVAAGLDPVGHLLAREVLVRANLLGQASCAVAAAVVCCDVLCCCAVLCRTRRGACELPRRPGGQKRDGRVCEAARVRRRRRVLVQQTAGAPPPPRPPPCPPCPSR